MLRFALMLAAIFVLSMVGADATQQGQTALRGWRQMDNCSRQAQAAYPDFTADSNAKRDAKLKECLNTYGLPPRQPLAQPRLSVTMRRPAWHSARLPSLPALRHRRKHRDTGVGLVA